MAVIYYPNSTSVYTRLVNGGLIEQTINTSPNTVLIFPTSSLDMGFTSSITAATASYLSASNIDGVVNSSSYSLSASWAPVGGGSSTPDILQIQVFM